MIYSETQLRHLFTKGLMELLNDGYMVLGTTGEYKGDKGYLDSIVKSKSQVVLFKNGEPYYYRFEGCWSYVRRRNFYVLGLFYDEDGRDLDADKEWGDFWDCGSCYADNETERDEILEKRKQREELKQEWPAENIMELTLKRTPWKGFKRDVCVLITKKHMKLTNRNGRYVIVSRGGYFSRAGEPLQFPKYELVRD